jgi:hypothetical protein
METFMRRIYFCTFALVALLAATASVGSVAKASPNSASPDEGKALVYAPAPEAPASNTPCDRTCLNGFVDKYFDAMASRCTCNIALAPNVKYTENGQVVKPGEGIWKTFARRGTYRVYLADVSTGTVGFYGDFSEDQGLLQGVMALRLKVTSRRISEIEIVIAREQLRPKGGLGLNTAGVMTPRMIDEVQAKDFVSPDAALLEPIPSANRATPQQLSAVADAYFNAFSQHSAANAPFADSCSRRENGIDATGNANGPVVDPAQPSFRLFSQSCAGEIDRGFFSGVSKFRDRRELVIDSEQGLVLDLAMFDNEGNVKSVSISGVGNIAVPSEFLRPITYMSPELFKVENGKIREIEGVSWAVPYGMKSGWTE